MRTVLAAFTVLVAACTSSPVAPTASPVVSSRPSTSATSPSPHLASSTTEVGPSDAATETLEPIDGPPAARLAAEGGDPVTGRLGTYVWHDQGSDSPWLPGAPIAVGQGEPLTVRLVPGVAVASWQARIVPADASGPAGAFLLARGSGLSRFDAPKPGAWTLELHLVFAEGAGDASYFWRLRVR